MTANELMRKICDEHDAKTEFDKQISEMMDTRNKLKCIEMLMEHYNCGFDEARMVMDFVIDQTPLPPDLTPQQIQKANQEAKDLLCKPTCPTCGSTNIQKISGISRAAHGYMFGLFSKTAKSQFCCKNCGYKW